MDRLTRNLDDLRNLVRRLAEKGISIQLVKENLVSSADSSMDHLMLSIMDAFAEIERSIIKERQM